MESSSLLRRRISNGRCRASAMVTRGSRALLWKLGLMFGDNGHLLAECGEAAPDHGDDCF